MHPHLAWIATACGLLVIPAKCRLAVRARLVVGIRLAIVAVLKVAVVALAVIHAVAVTSQARLQVWIAVGRVKECEKSLDLVLGLAAESPYGLKQFLREHVGRIVKRILRALRRSYVGVHDGAHWFG